MPLYEIASATMREIAETTFSAEGLKERGDLQRLLRAQIDIVSPDTLVIAEEFGDWDCSQRRIDLLGLDKNANLVVIELKRSEDGGHMELQALRYAAMISTMTFAGAVEVYSDYLRHTGCEDDAEAAILAFLAWDEPDEERFAQDVRILLVSADFSKEITTTVLWLNQRDLDIRCIRLKPYKHNGRVVVDVEQVIPLPEAAEYQVQVNTKVRQERQARKSSRQLRRFAVTINDQTVSNLPKRRAILCIVRHLIDVRSISPESIARMLEKWQPRGRGFWCVEGNVDAAGFEAAAAAQAATGRRWDARRYFLADEELMHVGQKTYAFTDQWGTGTEDAMNALIDAFPETSISFESDATG